MNLLNFYQRLSWFFSFLKKKKEKYRPSWFFSFKKKKKDRKNNLINSLFKISL
jgi:hypothetical protein